ncbi:MAG: hypothetical protein JWN46_3955, partial [Acidimicrobiales bacterium]|nr:hypothetical protein [Acidimicrobiales bacterium]
VRRRIGGFAAVLVVLGSLLAVPAAAAVTYRRAAHDPKAWVDVLGPLHDNPDVARSLARKFAETVAAAPGVHMTPAQQQLLAAATAQLIARPDFVAVWDAVVRDAQAQLRAMAAGTGPGTVVLHLEPLVRLVKSEAAARGIDLGRVQATDGDVVVITVSHASQVRHVSRLLDQAAVVLPIASVVLLVLGIAVARNRWKAVVLAGALVGLVATIGALAAATVLRTVASQVATAGYETAARRVADAVARPFAQNMTFLAVGGIVVAVVAALGRRLRRSDG